jgi:hypothetical protein
MKKFRLHNSNIEVREDEDKEELLVSSIQEFNKKLPNLKILSNDIVCWSEENSESFDQI